MVTTTTRVCIGAVFIVNAISPLTQVSAAASDFSYIGCYTDSQTRRLETFQASAAGNALTDTELQSCADSCAARAATDATAYVAIQNAKICYCSVGFPQSAEVDDTECSTRCGGSSLATSGCGGVFFNALYQVANDTTSCTNGKQDLNEFGVDCGGRCPTPCDLVVDGGFEDIYVLAPAAQKDITAAELAEHSAWNGTGGVVAYSGATFGNGLDAPVGDYYFGWFAGDTLSQVVNTTREGYSYRLSWQAASVSGDDASVIIKRDGTAIDQVTIFDRFALYSVEIECFQTTMELSFECASSASTSQACMIDAVNLTTIYECENVDDQTLDVYSGGYFSSCDDVLNKIEGTYTCSDDINDLFSTANNALAIPDEYCCTSCAVSEQISSDMPPSEEFPECATEGENCICTGTIYFGEPGGLDWSEVVSDGSGVACSTDNFGDTTVDAGANARCYCGGYSYVGCYNDVEVRPMEIYVSGNDNDLSSSNLETCITECRNAGYPYLVLQNAEMCFCSYGFPTSAKVADSQCETRCGESTVLVYLCGGTFINALYAITNDPYSCSNGVQDGGEGGVDCGGKCDTPCSYISSGSFEHITTTSTKKSVSTTTMSSSSAWSGSGYIVHSGNSFGNSQAAPEGTYYFAFPGLGKLSQLVNGTSAGYMLKLQFYASVVGTSSTTPTIQVSTGSPVFVDEVDLTDTFQLFTSDFDIYNSEFTLALHCNADSSAYCLLDAVNLTVTATCDDVVDDVMLLYSSKTVGSCETAIRDITSASLTCKSDTSDLFHTSELSAPDTFCCSTCATVEGNSAMLMPSDLYKLCAYEDHDCYCDGTIYFGVAGWGDWSAELSDGSAAVPCDTDEFGDPKEGFAKACYCDGKVSYAPSSSEYVGCFSSVAEADFEQYIGTFHNMTLSVCETMCMSLGKTFFAVSFGTNCFCSSGYPTTVEASASSNCATPCEDDSTEICGGEFFLSVYQIGPESGTCSDGVQDGAEEGIDCGGDCPDKCNLFLDGSFETLTTSQVDVFLANPGAWVGDVWIDYNHQGVISKRAVDGVYFAALYGRQALNQTVTGVCNGDILDLSYWAAKATVNGKSSPTLELISDDLLWEVEETDLTTSWEQKNVRLIVDQQSECCGDDCSLTLGFVQASDTYGAILDDVRLTVETQCEDLDDTQAKVDLGMTCEDLVVEMLRQGASCDALVSATVSSLSATGNTTVWDVCCSACWSTQTSHVDQAPNNLYTFCAAESDDCYCEGTVFFGIDNTYAWSFVESVTATRPVLCTTATFDDPNPSSRDPRNCYCSSHPVTPEPTTTKTTTSTTHIRTTTRTPPPPPPTTTQRPRTTTTTTKPAAAPTTAAPADTTALAVGLVLALLAAGAVIAVAVYVLRKRNLDNSKLTTYGGGALLSSSSWEMELTNVSNSSSKAAASAPFVSPKSSRSTPKATTGATYSKKGRRGRGKRNASHDSLL